MLATVLLFAFSLNAQTSVIPVSNIRAAVNIFAERDYYAEKCDTLYVLLENKNDIISLFSSSLITKDSLLTIAEIRRISAENQTKTAIESSNSLEQEKQKLIKKLNRIGIINKSLIIVIGVLIIAII